MAVEVINEDENMDISSYTTNSIIEYFKQGLHFHYVITVCDEAKKRLVQYSQVLMECCIGISQVLHVMEVMKRKSKG